MVLSYDEIVLSMKNDGLQIRYFMRQELCK